ncbi:MAG: ATP-binding protein [Candidatus Methanoplasma sp.]|jgi:predicted AAA+ superfamily ATPase|nr:ATP-binding protein [Candidatus Methanoplasma sp.]
MLRRKISDFLVEWKNTPKKNCLLVTGARQVGKTFIIDDFAKKNYGNYIYINFELSSGMKRIFDGDLDISTLERNLSVYFPNVEFEPGNLLIFLDEIQSCPNARVSLKSFSLDGRFDVIASGSLLGLNYKEVSSYPVGYETEIKLHSLDFEEFLWALGIGDSIISYISDAVRRKTPIDNSILEKMEEYYRWYAVVGGMPNAVNTFIETNNFGKVMSAQADIISGYMNDISKYAEVQDKARVKNTLRSIPAQLAKENKKFIYSEIYESKPGEGSREYGGSLSWLYDAGIVDYCYNLQEPAAPLASHMRPDVFKVYMHDTGLLLSMMEPGARIAMLDGDIKIKKGGIAENLTAEALSKKGIVLTYFEKKGRLEVDFILNLDGTVTALEVKSGNNRQSKSLDVVMSEKYNVGRGIKLENTNIYVDEDGVEHYPLFAAAFLF